MKKPSKAGREGNVFEIERDSLEIFKETIS